MPLLGQACVQAVRAEPTKRVQEARAAQAVLRVTIRRAAGKDTEWTSFLCHRTTAAFCCGIMDFIHVLAERRKCAFGFWVFGFSVLGFGTQKKKTYEIMELIIFD